jgi:uncharacterized membrane protein
LIPDIGNFLAVAIFKMATTIPHKFNIVWFQLHFMLEVININVRNFKFSIGFYSNPQTSWKFWKRRIAPLIVTYHYVKFYVSIIIQLEVININVRNFKFHYSYSFFLRSMNLSTADLRNYRTEFHETWWSYRYMFLVDPKVFRFVVKGVKNFDDIGQCWIFTPHFYAVFWQPFWKWQTSWKFWKRRIAPLMVTYHYVKFYVSIIIQFEVININVTFGISYY